MWALWVSSCHLLIVEPVGKRLDFCTAGGASDAATLVLLCEWYCNIFHLPAVSLSTMMRYRWEFLVGTVSEGRFEAELEA